MTTRRPTDVAFVATDNRGGMLRGRVRNADGTGANGVTVRLKDENAGGVIKTGDDVTVRFIWWVKQTGALEAAR